MNPSSAPASAPLLSRRHELLLLLTLAGIQFTHIMDFMIMMPLGPQFTTLFGITDAQFGLLVSAYTFAAGVSGLAASTYIDHFGRKRLMLVLYALFALATLACGLAPGYGALMAARVAAGAFGGVLSALSQTIIADVIPFERRGRAMGIVMSSFSVSTVAGVPIGLFMAAHWNWHAPFFLIAAICVLFFALAWITMPVLEAHLSRHDRPSMLGGIRQVLGESNHWRAFALSALMMFTGFTIIPYITIYVQTNVGLPAAQVPYLYLAGGVATLFSARLIGRLSDTRGKVFMFRTLAILVIPTMFALTLLPPVAIWLLLLVSTLMFVLMSGRMIPGMALLTAAADPRLRGTFMTLNASVQSAAMGLAAFVGGHLIGRDVNGHVSGYWLAATVGAIASLASVWMAGRLTLHGTGPNPGAAATRA